MLGAIRPSTETSAQSKKAQCLCATTNQPPLIGPFHMEWCSGCTCNVQHIHLESLGAGGGGGAFFFSFFFEGRPTKGMEASPPPDLMTKTRQ